MRYLIKEICRFKEEKILSHYQNNDLLVEEEEVFQVKKATLEKEQIELIFRLSNNTDRILSYTEEWQIEKEVDGKWYQWFESEEGDEVFHDIYAHSEKELSISVPVEENTDNSGNYRLIKEFGTTYGGGMQWYGAEFFLP